MNIWCDFVAHGRPRSPLHERDYIPSGCVGKNDAKCAGEGRMVPANFFETHTTTFRQIFSLLVLRVISYRKPPKVVDTVIQFVTVDVINLLVISVRGKPSNEMS